jgi:ferredoxin
LACIAACPVHIIKSKQSPHPLVFYGDEFCQYNCVECGRVCPAGAIRKISAEEKRRTRIGMSSLDFQKCVVALNKESCGACAEVCPTHAVRMVPYRESNIPGLTKPDFDGAYCIGCGACFAVCPAAPKAFVMTGVREQILTPGTRPAEDDGENLPEIPPADDFPF